MVPVLGDLRTLGEVVDRVSLLTLKLQRFNDPQNLDRCRSEHDSLIACWSDARLPPFNAVAEFDEISRIHQRLWDLEDQIRWLERDHRFDTEFLDCLRAIQATNRLRADCRREIGGRLESEHESRFLEIDSTLDAYVDRIAINEVIGVRRRNDAGAVAMLMRENWLESGLPPVFEGAHFARLRLANDRLWDIKDALDAGLARNAPGDEMVSVGRSLYLLNDGRCAAKRAIAAEAAATLWDCQEKTAYAPPPEWDAARLAWTTATIGARI